MAENSHIEGKNDLEAKKDGKNTYYLPVLGRIEFSAFVVKLSPIPKSRFFNARKVY